MRWLAAGLIAVTACGCSADEDRTTSTPVPVDTSDVSVPPATQQAPEEEQEAPPAPAGRRLDDQQDVLAQADALHRAGKHPSDEQSPQRGTTGKVRRKPRRDEKRDDGFVLRLPDPLPVATPTVHQGKVFVGAGVWLGAVEARTGETVWSRFTTDMGPSSAACEGALCAWSTFSCTVVVVDAASGDPISNTWLAPELISSPAVADGVAYAGYQHAGRRTNGMLLTGGIAAIDMRTGRTLWKRYMDRDAIGAPVVGNDTVHVATWGGTLYRFARANGDMLAAKARYAAAPPLLRERELRFSRFVHGQTWLAQLLVESIHNPSAEQPDSGLTERLTLPAPHADASVRFLFPDAKRKGAWPPHEAEPWPAPSARSRAATGPYSNHTLYQGYPVVAAGDLDVAVLGDTVVAFDGHEVRWSHDLASVYDMEVLQVHLHPERFGDRGLYAMPLGGYAVASLAASKARVVATTLDGRALIFDASTGEVLRTYDVGHRITTQPAMMDGWLYIGTFDGHLVAIDTGDPQVHGWSTYGGNARRTGQGTST